MLASAGPYKLHFAGRKPQRLKPLKQRKEFYGTTKVVPFPSARSPKKLWNSLDTFAG
jgi:hypothetical protein